MCLFAILSFPSTLQNAHLHTCTCFNRCSSSTTQWQQQKRHWHQRRQHSLGPVSLTLPEHQRECAGLNNPPIGGETNQLPLIPRLPPARLVIQKAPLVNCTVSFPPGVTSTQCACGHSYAVLAQISDLMASSSIPFYSSSACLPISFTFTFALSRSLPPRR